MQKICNNKKLKLVALSEAWIKFIAKSEKAHQRKQLLNLLTYLTYSIKSNARAQQTKIFFLKYLSEVKQTYLYYTN